jgi:hypothetical protein
MTPTTMLEPEQLNIGNVCRGAAVEVFEKALAEVLKNIADPNTLAEAKRGIALKFDFKPMKDRSGAEVTFKCDTKLAGIEAVSGSIFISKQAGTLRGYTRDIRQDMLFAKEETPTPRQ